jgi:hypothetical protein
MKKLTIIAFVALVLQGCATSTITHEQRMHAKSKLPEIEQNQAQVCFVREARFMGAPWKPDIKENGKIIGIIKNGSYFCHNTNSGQRTFVASTTLDYDREIDITLVKNTRSFVQYYIRMGAITGNGKLKEIDESLALNKIYPLSKK